MICRKICHFIIRVLRRLCMNYPLPRNHFQVDWGGARLSFSEVSGLGIEVDAPQFRDGQMPEYHDVSMPGQLRYPPLILRRHVTKGDNDFYKWLETIRLNTVERRDILVSLLDEQHQPTVTWKFKNAFPVRLDYSPLDAECCGPMMETLEIRHEGMVVENRS
jgi:phage tail-like protein